MTLTSEYLPGHLHRLEEIDYFDRLSSVKAFFLRHRIIR